MMIGKKTLQGHKGFVFALGAAFLMVASFAWACTPALTVQMSANSGPAGTLVQLTGGSAYPDRPVEIRWNSADGALLGAVQGDNFAVAVKVPADAAPGVYYLVAAGRARDTFEVTGPEGESVPKSLSSDLWSGFSGSARPALSDAAQTGDAAELATSNSLPIGLGLAGAGLGGLMLSSLILIKKRSRARSA